MEPPGRSPHRSASAAAPAAPPVGTEDTFEDLYNEAPVAYFSTSPDDVITRVNGTFLAWTGHRGSEVIGRRFVELLDPGTRLFYAARRVPVLRDQGEVREVAVRVLCADGSMLPVLLNSVAVPGADGGIRTIRSAMFDATDRSQYERELLTERQLAESAARRVQLLQNASTAFAASTTEHDLAEALADIVRTATAAGDACVALLDTDGSLTVVGGVNPLEGLAPENRGQAASDTLQSDAPTVVSAEDVDSPYPDVVTALDAAGLARVMIFPMVRDEVPIGVVAAFFARDTNLEPEVLELVAAICRQAGQSLLRIRLQDQLSHLASHDQLTGLPNRALLHEHVSRSAALTARAKQPLALMFLDLDGFKRVNDELGHTCGDGVLREVARRLKAVVREGDLVGRLGGDEFVVICHDAQRAEAERVAERVRNELAQPYDDVSAEFAVSASIGLLVVPPTAADAMTADALLARADDEMYLAKNAGRNRVSVCELASDSTGSAA